MNSSNTSAPNNALETVEVRSIDYVPLSERRGKLTDQATIWFAGSAHLLTLATGAIGITLGLNLGWTLIALAIGTFLGTIPVSAHATQGPHLGLPQLIQSRPQFGRYGAVFIAALAIVIYWGYVVVGGDLLGATAAQLTGGGAPIWAVAICLVAILLAAFGYHWLHTAQRYITVALIVAIIIYTIGLSAKGFITADLFDLTQTFDLSAFLVVVAAATGYQLTWAFFVSDYSRYMPANTNKPAIIGMTSLGLFFGLFSFMAIGALGAVLMPTEDIISAFQMTGDLVFPGLGVFVLIAGGLGLLGLMGMCVYGGSLTLITTLDSIRTLRPTRSLRIITILVIGLTSTVATLAMPEDFLNTSFSTVLLVVGYLMGPWTSINLTDFFVIRRGQYSVTEMFKKNGVYGLWNWRGITAYLGTILVMSPFMNVGFFEGPIAAAMGGVDIAFFVGIPVGCALYWMLCRSQRLEREMEIVVAADVDLDKVAEPIA